MQKNYIFFKNNYFIKPNKFKNKKTNDINFFHLLDLYLKLFFKIYFSHLVYLCDLKFVVYHFLIKKKFYFIFKILLIFWCKFLKIKI